MLALSSLRIDTTKLSSSRADKIFRKNFGSSSEVVSRIWRDILEEDRSLGLVSRSKMNKNLKQYLIAMYWLWTYPKNAEATATAFGMRSSRNCQGKALWSWIERIASLKEKKVVWKSALDDPETAIFIITVDGTDFRCREPKHPTMPVDQKFCSHKHKHAAVRYEIALSIFTGNVVWVSDPYPAGVHDMTIFRSGLKKKVKPHKLVVADRGYRSGRPDEKFMSTPNEMDSKEVAKFKSRARCRQESFNGRLKNFSVLADTYRHDITKHKFVLQAVVVIVQTQIDLGASLFEV